MVKGYNIEEILEKKKNNNDYLSAFSTDVLNDIHRITTHFFGDDWEFQAGLNNTINVILHYDEITVKNKNNEMTVIYDVYVKVLLSVTDDDTIAIDYISLARATYTPGQHSTGYTWSHATRHDPTRETYYSDLCYGNDVFSKFINYFETQKFSSRLWGAFLLQLRAYLEWESITGGPYVSIKDINVKNYNITKLITQKEVNNVLNIIGNIPLEYLKVNYDGMNYTIDMDTIYLWLEDKIPKDYKVLYDSNNNPFVISIITNYHPVIKKTNIWFKNENKSLTFVPDSPKTVKFTRTGLHPVLFKAVKEYLERKLIIIKLKQNEEDKVGTLIE